MAPYNGLAGSPNGGDEYEVDYDNNITRLYEAITNCDWDVAIKAAAESPREAETWVVRHYENSEEIMWRFLPIHSACARQPPASVISSLLNAFPGGARCVDDQGMYPLHYACGNQASREVVRLLLVANPQAAKITDPRGMLPIHYLACWGPSSVSIIDMILVANRNVGEAKDAEGNTPLQLAEEGEYPERDQVISALKRWAVSTSSAASTTSSRDAIELPTLEAEDNKSADTGAYPGSRSSSKPAEPHGRSSPATTTRSGNAGTASTSLTISRLRQEMSKMKADQQKKKEEWDSQTNKQIGSLKAQCYDLEKQVSNAHTDLQDADKRIRQLESLLHSKEQEMHEQEQLYREMSRTFADLQAERDDLRQTLTEVSDECEVYRRKNDNMNARFASVAASLDAMMDGQDQLMQNVQNKDSRLAEASALRRSKLQALLNLEDEFLSEILDRTEDETSITTSINRQSKEMGAIQAVISTVRS